MQTDNVNTARVITSTRSTVQTPSDKVSAGGTSHRLALLGGSPAFAEKLHVGRPNIGERAQFLSLIEDVLDRRWLTNDGPFVQLLERRIASFSGVKHCIAMCNATVALEIAIRALDLTGEVIIPSYTFIATAHALQWQQITPVFADVREDTHCLDPVAVEKMITPKTTGIIGVHLWGQACDVTGLVEVARRRRLRLMFDAAHAFGCTYQGRMIGNNGDCEVLSFHATKFFNTLEGGAILTNDDTLAEKMRLMRNFGFAGYDNVVYIGTNGKMNEVAAAMGLTNLDSIDKVLDVNRRNWLAYRDGLVQAQGLKLLNSGKHDRSNYQYVVVEIDPEQAGLTRDDLVAVLHAENVIARKYFWPGCHRMEPYKSLYPHAGLVLPVTEKISNRVLLLPTGTQVTPESIHAICRVVRTALARPAEVRAATAFAS